MNEQNQGESLFQYAITEFIGQEEGEQSKLVYSYFGLAMYFAQCIEHTFENMLIVEKFANGENVDKEFVDDFFEKMEKSKATMGKQINNVKKVYSISNEHTKKLENVLQKRNYLAHNFFKVNSFKFFTEEGKLEMIKECTDFIDNNRSLDAKLNSYYEDYKKKIGITNTIIDKEYELAKKEELERIKDIKIEIKE